jgi:hypothetical protein
MGERQRETEAAYAMRARVNRALEQTTIKIHAVADSKLRREKMMQLGELQALLASKDPVLPSLISAKLEEIETRLRGIMAVRRLALAQLIAGHSALAD